MEPQVVYLDHAAATPVDERVMTAMQPYFADHYYNPSGNYTAARQVRAAIDEARAQIAHQLGCRPSEVVFTAGGTEANNVAIHGIMRRHPDSRVVATTIEHDSVLQPMKQYSHAHIPVAEDGRVAIADLHTHIPDDTVLVSVQYVNNEIGTIQPIKQIAAQIELIRRQRRDSGNSLPIYFHVDACQATAYLDIHVARLGVDMMTLNAGKIYGPKQVGALYVKGGIELNPMIMGGGQERGIRSGTENTAGIIGFAQALTIASEMRHEESRRLAQLQQTFYKLLTDAIPEAVITGSRKFRVPNNVHVVIPGQDNERLLILLDQAGIICAAGSACSASSETPSHVLLGLGMSEADARASLRFSMGRSTTEANIHRAVEALARIVV